jgi:hypothetical protein
LTYANAERASAGTANANTVFINSPVTNVDELTFIAATLRQVTSSVNGNRQPGLASTADSVPARGVAKIDNPGEQIIWEHFLREQARGRTPTGAEVDRPNASWTSLSADPSSVNDVADARRRSRSAP